MSEKPVQKGDEVSWNWAGSHPSGKLAEVKTSGDISIQSKKGNTIKKHASPDNPAVHLERSGNDVVKRQSELDQPIADSAKPGSGSGAAQNGHKEDKKEEQQKNGHAGEKHARGGDDKDGHGAADKGGKAEGKKDGHGDTDGHSEKKHKANGAADKKGRGRPPKNETTGAGAGKVKNPSKPRAKKEWKPKAEPLKDSIGSRTRSRAKA